MRFIKLILKGKEIGEYKSLYVSSCRISLMTQFPSNSHANLTAKRRKRRKSHFHNFCKKKGVLGKQVSQF